MFNVRKTCEDCGNKDICRYVKDLDSKIKRIEAISEDSNLLLVDICCKRWMTTKTLTRNEEVVDPSFQGLSLKPIITNPYIGCCCDIPAALSREVLFDSKEENV